MLYIISYHIVLYCMSCIIQRTIALSSGDTRFEFGWSRRSSGAPTGPNYLWYYYMLYTYVYIYIYIYVIVWNICIYIYIYIYTHPLTLAKVEGLRMCVQREGGNWTCAQEARGGDMREMEGRRGDEDKMQGAGRKENGRPDVRKERQKEASNGIKGGPITGPMREDEWRKGGVVASGGSTFSPACEPRASPHARHPRNPSACSEETDAALQSRASGLQSATQGIPSGPKKTPPSQTHKHK